MIVHKFFSKVAASATIFSLAFTPDIAAACSFHAPVEVISDHMRQKCRSALASQKKFLAKVKADHLKEGELGAYVVAFDEGKYGCRKNTKFVFKILDSFYSVPERKFSEPRLLQRYAYNWPDNYALIEKEYVQSLIWLFEISPAAYSLPKGWTAEQARAFVEKPEHWPIALAKFGTEPDRDDAVFASISDPKSPYFDRETALRLSAFSSKQQLQRKVTTASLYADPRYGTSDFAKAESLLPTAALYRDDDSEPLIQRAHAAWKQVGDGYAQSSDAALRSKGREIKTKMSRLALTDWPTIEKPKDGRVWLSLSDWPQSLTNPFFSARMAQLINANDYPARAMRKEEQGNSTIAARFGPDGRFSGLEVIQSSGSVILDEAAMKNIQRRFRPKLDTMTLTGYSGQEVRVPMLIVEWRINRDDAIEGSSSYTDGKLKVFAQRYPEPNECGRPPSVFV